MAVLSGLIIGCVYSEIIIINVQEVYTHPFLLY